MVNSPDGIALLNELQTLLQELDSVRAECTNEEKLKVQLEQEIADLKLTLEFESEELHKSALQRRHEAETGHKLAIRRQQETLDAMGALVQQEKQLKKIAKGLGIKDRPEPPSPLAQLISRIRKSSAGANARERETFDIRQTPSEAICVGPVKYQFQRPPTRLTLTALMRKKAMEQARDSVPKATSTNPIRGSASRLVRPPPVSDQDLMKRNTFDLTSPRSEGVDGLNQQDSSRCACPVGCQPHIWREFLEVYDRRGRGRIEELLELPLLRRIAAADLTQCLAMHNGVDAARWLALLASNSLVIEPDLRDTATDRICGMAQRAMTCTHRFQIRSRPNCTNEVQRAARVTGLMILCALIAPDQHSGSRWETSAQRALWPLPTF